ncbi:MAG TPA: hypothetical protein VHM28_06055 [Anaerolineales bacterium]|jgi:hypothetical protein|nr:hypothetical protein [Anaerolineales bacterium]
MNMKTLEAKEGYLFAQYTDDYRMGACLDFMKGIAEACRREGLSKALCDVRGMMGKIDIVDSFQLAVAGVLIFDGIQLAGVYRREDMDLFAETVIRNRGGNVRLFSDIESAKQWLGVE